MKRLLISMTFLLFIVACNTEPVINEKARSIETGVSPEEWVTVPSGEYFHGMHSHDSVIDYDYQVMKTPVTNKLYAEYLNKALAADSIKIENNKVMGYYPGEQFDGYDHEKKIEEGYKIHLPLDEPGGYINYQDGKFYVDKGFENHPVVMVTWFGAKAYADYYEYRLPTEAEWEKAARGTDKRPYPWGDEIDPNIANYTHREHNLKEILETSVARTTPAGFYNGDRYNGITTQNNQSPYGLYDMAGNVWEWTADDYEDTHYRYMRGGSFSNYEYKVTVWARNSAGPGYYSFNTGFRCVR